jgi:hypothetical protein
MSETHHEYRQEFSPNDIAAAVEVIHPALDWVNGQLIMGVVLNNQKRGIISSMGKIVTPADVGKLCKHGETFSSPVTANAAEAILHPDAEAPKITSEDLVQRISEHIRHFVAFRESWMLGVVATWVLATYVYPVYQAFPYLWITSPEPGCGKSVLGQAIARLAFNGEFMTAPNEAHLFRLAEQSRGVQVWDEVELKEDGERRRFENIKAILLNGYRNGGAVPRQAGRNWEKVEKFHVFCPRVFIGLSELPEAALQRTIRVKMTKRSKDADSEIYDRSKHGPAEQDLRDDCVVWALQSAPEVAAVYYDPSGLRKKVEEAVGEVGRQADDIWLPLFSVSRANSTVDSEGSRVYASLSAGAVSHRDSPSPSTSSVKHSGRFGRQAEPEDGSIEDQEALRAALEMLGMLATTKPIPPTELAELVSSELHTEVSAQKISKGLGRLGITSKKKSGMRMFQASPKQLAAARKRLGIREDGQDGRDGQEIYVEEERI